MFKSMLALMMLIAAAVASPAPLLANKQPPPKIGPDNDCTFLLLDRYDTDVFEVKFTYHIHYPGNNIDLFNFSGGSAAWHRSSESPDKRTVEHCYKIVRGWDWAIACFRFPRVGGIRPQGRHYADTEPLAGCTCFHELVL
ncbi:uncharacterized protein L969DRAFT_88050 [Mixia osmundae IAM 14324]|uniref:uncharacterized protein n=1 Tax=Mixia osmundae (strain CBS 9802 / IAM 14324 / JCM 22182 / KY 12970) TaxID=764103 RepID=UPI0004A5569F|nr:uncharacterized protein L969DRAFT_88050 [Mixia osmundae IAM 14324]KEI38769.1 hypothetical protein L969DRAFT_88050 [Mixia osmundae IAM 14324]